MLLIAALVVSGSILRGDPVQHVSEEPAFDATWARTDLPVSDGVEARTWFWGPAANSDLMEEPNELAPHGVQTVQYFDKARMELPDPDADPKSPGYVLAGLLVSELVSNSGMGAASITVAGDLGDPDGVTYATIGTLVDARAIDSGTTLASRIDSDGTVTEDESLAEFGVTAEYYIVETDHTIASVFWEFLNSSGTVWDGTGYTEARLFPDPFFGAGFPITEAYWTRTNVDGESQNVLLQCFQRRCLTYTPGNPEGWQVESNNAGLHYYQWRYGEDAPLDPTATAVASSTIEPTASAGPSATPEPSATSEPTVTTSPEIELPEVEYTTSGGETHTMLLEVAATPATRACGLMHRDSLPEDTGMLFIFDQDTAGGFWNCNTFVPLTLAWIDADGTIIGFSDMEPQVRGEPQVTTTYPPPGPYRYVIEANRGWFAERGIETRDQADLEQAIAYGDTASDTLCQQLGLACN